MIKICDKCHNQYEPTEKKCPVCGKKLKNAYTKEETEKMKKEEEDTMVVLNTMFFM